MAIVVVSRWKGNYAQALPIALVEDADRGAEADMTLRTKLTELLGIRHPVLLAPMGNAAGGALAAAVSGAGGFGLIGGSLADDPTWLAREFVAARQPTRRLWLHHLALERHPEVLDLALEHSPPAMMLSPRGVQGPRSTSKPNRFTDAVRSCPLWGIFANTPRRRPPAAERRLRPFAQTGDVNRPRARSSCGSRQ
jgi:hypothetical protein